MTEFSFETLLEQWPGLTPEERLHAFQSLPPERSEEFFLELNSRQQSDLLQDLPDGINRLWIRQLAPDAAADLIQFAPDAAADLIQFAPKDRWPHLLGLLDETSRREVTALLAYQEDAAGGLMSPRFARLRPEMTADEAISYLRRQTSHLEPSTTATSSTKTSASSASPPSATSSPPTATASSETSCALRSSKPPKPWTRKPSPSSSPPITSSPSPT